MDFSNMILLRPALNQIKSSFASTTSYISSRLLSFTGSFNDRTSLLHEKDVELGRPTEVEEAGAAPLLPAAAAPAAASVMTTEDHLFDIEAGTTTPLAPITSAPEGPATLQVDTESRRVGKTVQTVCLFAASASLVLFGNLSLGPAGQGQHARLYMADMVFIGLGFFSSLLLSMYSIVRTPGEAGEAVVARVQKCGMVVAMASVLVAFWLRLWMMPTAMPTAPA